MKFTHKITLLLSIFAGACGSNYASKSKSENLLIEPIIERTSSKNLDCRVQIKVPGIWSNLRKDYYLNEKDYDEYPEAPKNGGRFQVALSSLVTGTITKVLLNGQNLEDIYIQDGKTSDPVEWFHVWPKHVKTEEPLWLNFHSRAKYWDINSSAHLIIETDNGNAFDGEFKFSKTTTPFTYITTDAGRNNFLIHLKNSGHNGEQLTKIVVNGIDVTDIVIMGSRNIGSGDSTLITVPQCQQIALGSAYTVVAEFLSGQITVGTGRVIRPHFPIEAWNNTSECPFRIGNLDNYQRMKQANFDTIYTHGGVCGQCGCDSRVLLEDDLGLDPDWGTIATDDMGFDLYPLKTTRGIRAFSTGDESDGTLFDEETGIPKAAIKADKSRRLWDLYPEIPTFNGGKTNKNIGSFAGMSDIQGMDLYVAACAPHITKYLNPPPLRGAYDYLLNTRNNHMPQPTWLYTQGLAPTWNQDPIFSGKKSVQPDHQEIKVQAMSAIAAGAKGLMYFQVNEEEAQKNQKSWQAISEFNQMIKPIVDDLRSGDLTGMVSSEGGLIIDMIRSENKLIVPVISLRTDKEVGDLACASAFVTGKFPHWRLKSRGADFQLRIPEELGISDWYELSPQGKTKPNWNMKIENHNVFFKDLPFDNNTPVRLFVFEIAK